MGVVVTAVGAMVGEMAMEVEAMVVVDTVDQWENNLL
jgi:hypothetical protein